jgi:hypothetical protein
VRALLLIGSAAILAGCTCAASLNQNQVGLGPIAFRADVEEIDSTTATKTQKLPPVRSGKNTNSAAKRTAHAVAAKGEPPPPAQLEKKTDPLIEKAKAVIRKMMADPASVEFGEIRRVAKNLLGEPVNAVCGHVNGKAASGGSTGEMAFLYVIQEDEAYLVDGNNPMAETGYRNLCE